jgi:hypothetical protein
MAEAETLPPVEIPWKLASTTQPLAGSGPAETALSLFFYEPDDEKLTRDFPDEKLVFLKFTASIAPAAFPRELSRVAASYLGEGIPCLHVLLDLSVNEEGAGDGSTRPYFHTAAPLSRRFVQTGVIGTEIYEGEAEGVAVGKSGSQMHETLRSHSGTTTATASAGISGIPIPVVGGLFSASGSVRTSSTDVASARNVAQSSDAISRNASDERRELTSHTTRVENIISLLSAKYLGTPHLRFSVSPQPLQQLAIDPNDPNLWFQQLLARRSTGIEGIQEFIALVVVPKDKNVCVHARLRRVCLLDSPPVPLAFEERFTGSLVQLARLVNYLNRAFPPGTPLDELDIDITGAVRITSPNVGALKRPVISLWALRLLENLVVANVVSPSEKVGVSGIGQANYKHMLEVWLDTLRDEYEIEISRSPLERGVLFGENRFLQTCFVSTGEGEALKVSSSDASVSPLLRVPFTRGTFDIGGVKTLSSGDGSSTRSGAVATVVRWNVLEAKVTSLLANNVAIEGVPFTPASPEITSILIDVWRKLRADDPRNLEFDEAAEMLGLSDKQKKLLRGAGATNLSTIASLIALAADIEHQNSEVQKLRELSKERKVDGLPLDVAKGAPSIRDSAAIVQSISKTLWPTRRQKD